MPMPVSLSTKLREAVEKAEMHLGNDEITAEDGSKEMCNISRNTKTIKKRIAKITEQESHSCAISPDDALYTLCDIKGYEDIVTRNTAATDVADEPSPRIGSMMTMKRNNNHGHTAKIIKE